jgi:outer membrane protein
MKIIFVSALLISFLITDPKLRAQEKNVWNLDSCIHYAMKNAFSVQQQELAISYQEMVCKQSRYNILPNMSAETGYSRSFGFSVDPSSNSYVNYSFFNNYYGVYASATLFQGFEQLNRVRYERYNYLAASAQLDKVKNTVNYNITEAYFNVLFQNELLQLTRDNYLLSEYKYKGLVKMIEVGRKPESDRYDVEAKMATDSMLLIVQAKLARESVLNLKQLINYPYDKELTIDTVAVFVKRVPDSLTVSMLYEKAASQLPDLKLAEYKLRAGQKYLKVSRGGFSPQIDISAGYTTKYNQTQKDDQGSIISYKQQMRHNASQYVDVSLAIPLFGKFSRFNAVSRANLQVKMAQKTLEEEQLKLRKELELGLLDLNSLYAEYTAAAKQLDKTSMAYISAEKKLQNGLLNYIDFNIQKNELLKARTEVSRTRLQLIFKDKYIHFLESGQWTE